MAIARRRASRSRSSASTQGRSPRCRSRRRSGTSAARRSIATTDTAPLRQGRAPGRNPASGPEVATGSASVGVRLLYFSDDPAIATFRYDLPAGDFEELRDAGMWVSRVAVTPSRCDALSDLPLAFAVRGVDLRVV